MGSIGFLMNYHGIEKLGDAPSTEELRPTMTEMVDISKQLPNDIGTKAINAKTLKQEASSFYCGRYDVHKVGVVKNIIEILKMNYCIKKEKGTIAIADHYNKSAVYKDPFDLPIHYLDDFNEGGSICFHNEFMNELYPEDLIQSINCYFTGINLSTNIEELTIPFYIHEITHSQVDSKKGTIREYYHEELLSIYNEILYSYQNKELFEKNLAMRIRYMIQEFMAVNSFLMGTVPRQGYKLDDAHTSMSYIKSTLKAFQLLHLYSISSSKEQFDKEINKVLSGEIKLEDLLESKDITDESMLSSEHVRKLL